jgi:hypothetical protein
MSQTLSDFRAQMKRELADAANQDFKTEVQRVQRANPGMSFETAWNKAEREKQNWAPEPTTIGEAANLLKGQNPTWTFERSWSHAAAVYPALVRGSTAKPLHPDPQIAQEMGKITKLDPKSQTATVDDHTDRLVKIRKVMKEKGWNFDQAFTEICKQENAAKTASARYTAQSGTILVECEYSVPLVGKCPAEIMYMPAGKSKIRANVNGKAKEITVDVGPMTASLLQSSLLRLLADPVKPFIDFSHRGEEAAATPKGFRWSPEGVMMSLDWTSAGKAAVEGNTYRWFSPTFLLSEAGEPSGPPETGPVGALTNNPAFRGMRGITATRA